MAAACCESNLIDKVQLGTLYRGATGGRGLAFRGQGAEEVPREVCLTLPTRGDPGRPGTGRSETALFIGA